MRSAILSFILLSFFSMTPAGAFTPETTYADLPCMTEAELKAQFPTLNLEEVPGALCGDGSQKEIVGKILKALPLLKLENVSATANPRVDAALQNPADFVAKRVQKIIWNRMLMIESHRARGSQEVELASHYFIFTPYEAVVDLLALLADSEKVVGYGFCWMGKYNRRDACESYLSSSEAAGFSSAKVLLLWKLADHVQDTEVAHQIRALATTVVLDRIRNLPSHEAVSVETLYALGSDGRLYVVDPYTQAGHLVNLPYPEIGFIERMKYDQRKGGLLLISNLGKVFRFSDWNRQAKVLPLPFPVKDYETSTSYVLEAFTPKNFPIDVAIDTSNKVWLISQIGDNAGKKPWPAQEHQLPFHLKSIRSCWVGASCLLDVHGREWGFYYLFSNVMAEEYYNNDEGLPWRFIGSDYLNSEMIGVNEAGKLYFRPDGAGITYEQDPVFQADTTTSFRYLETTSFRVLADIGNKLHISREYAQRVTSGLPNTKGQRVWNLQLPQGVQMVDIERTLSVYSAKALTPALANDDFEKICELSKVIYNPWTRKKIGLNNSGQVVFQGENNQCHVMDNAQFPGAIRLAIEADPTEKLQLFPETGLVVYDAKGKRHVFAPYN